MDAGSSWLARKMSEPRLTIRPFKYPDDYPVVYTLWSTAGPGIHVRRSDDSDEIAKKLQRDPDLFLLAELDEQVVGTVLGGFDGRRGMVYHLAVAEACRQRGIGSALMDELERRLRQKGCLRYYLLVTNDNLDAMRFYQALGWEEMDLHIYAKDIG
jgi:ribosomal protein S18 acetylase RimI-like enzyme